jgi:small nuclear ribonucleoprotein (snRNP)-like protein
MNHKSILTKLIAVISIFLLLQPAFAQIAKPKKTMTAEQIEAFLQEAQKKKWEITIKSPNATISGKISSFDTNGSVFLTDTHPVLLDACVPVPEFNQKSTDSIHFKEITQVGKRNLLTLGLRSAGEISLASLSMAIFVAALPVIATTEAMKKH